MSILSHSHCIINMNPSDTCPKKAETKNQDEATAPQNDKDLWRTISEKEDQLDERIENLLKDLEAHEIDDDNDVLKYDFSQSRNNYEIFQRDILPIVGLRAPNIWTERYKPCVKERQRDENEVIKQELEDIRTQTDSRSNFTKRHLLHNKCRSQSFVGQSPYAITPTSSELVLDTDVCDYLMTHLYSPRCLSNHTNIYQQTREERLQGINAVSTIPSELVWPRDKYGLRIPSDTILNNFHKILIHEQKTGKCMTPSELQLRLGANRSNTGTRTEASVQTDPAMNSTSPTPFQMYVALRRDIARIKAEEDKHKQLNMMQNLLEHHRNINYLRDLPLATYMTYKYPQEDNVKPESYWASARPRTHQYVVRPSEERRNNRVNQTTLITTPSQTEALDKKTYEQLRQLRREIEELQQEHARLSENTSPKMSHGAMLKRSMVNKSFSYDSKLRKAHQENVQPRLPFSLPSLPESSDSIKKFGCASWEPAISPIQSKSTLASRLLTEVQVSDRIADSKSLNKWFNRLSRLQQI